MPRSNPSLSSFFVSFLQPERNSSKERERCLFILFKFFLSIIHRTINKKFISSGICFDSKPREFRIPQEQRTIDKSIILNNPFKFFQYLDFSHEDRSNESNLLTFHFSIIDEDLQISSASLFFLLPLNYASPPPDSRLSFRPVPRASRG